MKWSHRNVAQQLWYRWFLFLKCYLLILCEFYNCIQKNKQISRKIQTSKLVDKPTIQWTKS